MVFEIEEKNQEKLQMHYKAVKNIVRYGLINGVLSDIGDQHLILHNQFPSKTLKVQHC